MVARNVERGSIPTSPPAVKGDFRDFRPGAALYGWVVVGALPLMLDRGGYHDQLRGMWLAQTVANWTGLRTEIQFNNPPFPTDASWGGFTQRGRIEFVFQDPWLADDDTDIEYVYLHLMHQWGREYLSPAIIADGWRAHINRYIWVSNQRARNLMNSGLQPPATGMWAVNPDALMIDAQLTTEFFGAIAPGMPWEALRLADLPIRTSSTGYATHAAQFHVVLYSLAPVVDRSLSGEEQVLWLVDEASRYFPDTSKTMEVVRFVREDYLSNPDKNNWERTRDRIYERYHRDAARNGFVYRGEFESTVNFGVGITALLYGQGNIPRTIQIGTLGGWDSDNPTATMGGLLGLMHGAAAVEQQFGRTLSDRFQIRRTRDGLPDYLPNDGAAEDTFTLMADRMLLMVDRTVRRGGGRLEDDVYRLPPRPRADHLLLNPVMRVYQGSANNQVRLRGGTVEAFSSSNAANAWRFANGEETDFSGREVFSPSAGHWRSANSTAEKHWLAVTWSEPLPINAIRFVEGPRDNNGGWFDEIGDLRVLVGEHWVPVITTPNEEMLPSVPYQTIDFLLSEPKVARGVWIEGTGHHVTCLELDGLMVTPWGSHSAWPVP